jgi:hypothetical protein
MTISIRSAVERPERHAVRARLGQFLAQRRAGSPALELIIPQSLLPRADQVIACPEKGRCD